MGLCCNMHHSCMCLQSLRSTTFSITLSFTGSLLLISLCCRLAVRIAALALRQAPKGVALKYRLCVLYPMSYDTGNVVVICHTHQHILWQYGYGEVLVYNTSRAYLNVGRQSCCGNCDPSRCCCAMAVVEAVRLVYIQSDSLVTSSA